MSELIERIEKMVAENPKLQNLSPLYFCIKDKILTMDYAPQELPFPGEFICFEDDYISIYKHIKANNIPGNKIIDIGCQYGFQSEFFKDEYQYLGIDPGILKFFNQNEPNVAYANEIFPFISEDISSSIVISNMSLGFFNDHHEGVTDESIAAKLVEANTLYIRSTESLIEKLKEINPHFEIIQDSRFNSMHLFRKAV